MTKATSTLFAIVLLCPLTSCDKGEHGITSDVAEHHITVSFYELVRPMATVAIDEENLLWRIEAQPASGHTYLLYDSVKSTASFVPLHDGDFTLCLLDTSHGGNIVERYHIGVKPAVTNPSPYIAQVFDILPAPGQFVNQIPLYRAEGDEPFTDYLNYTRQSLVGRERGDLISLGGFGGYIVFGFDHTIPNVPDTRDFRVDGNSFYATDNPNPTASERGGSAEPGIIEVMYDSNHNGQPDDVWYEIAGSEYHNPATIHNYEITYYRPTTETNDPDWHTKSQFVTIEHYIRWEDNQGESGWIAKNMYHSQSYYPGWITADQITFRGTKLPANAIDESGTGSYWVLYPFDYGYADNLPNDEQDNAIDIDWAVDDFGQPVYLPGIDFVRVTCGMRQECGWLGETSTEIQGATDLHLQRYGAR
ncbi:MAG: hypothetical protein Q4E55_07155 [Bacteroidales bacterium]|nr:hypothetical protein [Bacteroidales bacterium]